MMAILGTAHTQERYSAAFYQPFLSDRTVLKVGRRRERFRRPSMCMRFISMSSRNLSRLRLRSCGGMRRWILLPAAKVKVAQQPILSS